MRDDWEYKIEGSESGGMGGSAAIDKEHKHITGLLEPVPYK